MARRIEIELTSARPDGTWTWRAAGALKPRGMLTGTLLYRGAKAGDVVRADAEFEVEGITIVAVLAPKEKNRAEPDRLEVIGPPREPTPGVTTSLTSRGAHDAGDRPGRGPRRTGEGGPGSGHNGRDQPRPGRPGADRGDRSGPRPGGQARAVADGTPRPGSDQPGRSGPERAGRPAGPSRPSGSGRPGGSGRPDGGGRPDPSDRPGTGRGSRDAGPARPRPEIAAARGGEGQGAARPKVKRLSPASTHRTAALESLPPEHRPIAEQLLRGGIPAVRTAIHLEREKATAEGRPAPNAEALLQIGEDLLPRLRAAEWRDRAEAADKMGDELPLRDLRSVVDSAHSGRDDESRHLAAKLREALDQRAEAVRMAWLDEIRGNLTETRLVRALRLSSRPPDPTTRLPSDLATQLASAAGAAMAADTPPDRWAALLDAVAASPVRRAVKPAAMPADPGGPLLQAARQQSGRVPALASMLGISMPPPPGPIRRAPSPTP